MSKGLPLKLDQEFPNIILMRFCYGFTSDKYETNGGSKINPLNWFVFSHIDVKTKLMAEQRVFCSPMSGVQDLNIVTNYW